MTQKTALLMSRIDAQTSLSVRKTIDRTAAMQGRPRTGFLIAAALENAEQAIAVQSLVRIALEEQRSLAGALLSEETEAPSDFLNYLAYGLAARATWILGLPRKIVIRIRATGGKPMTLLFRLLPAGASRDGFTRGDKALEPIGERRPGRNKSRGAAAVLLALRRLPNKVIGFYTLAAASVLLTDMPKAEARRMRAIPLFRRYVLDALP